MRNNSTLAFLLSSLLALAGPISCGHAASEQKAYGTRVKYRTDQIIEFQDFVIEYVGERRQSVSAYPRIGPVAFEISGKHYQLELRHSDKLGKLNDNELVIWQAKPPS